MSSSILVLVACLANYYNSFEQGLISIDPFVFFTAISFIFFFGRLFYGDSHFTQIAGDLGINTIFHSKKSFIRNKRIYDAILLSLQSVGFVFLAWFVNQPFLFLVVFHLTTLINIFWLLYQHYCLVAIVDCITKKYQNNWEGYTKEIYLSKVTNKISLINLVYIWLVNNIFFTLGGILFFSLYHDHPELAIIIGLSFTLFNSAVDLFNTWKFYSQPEKYFDK